MENKNLHNDDWLSKLPKESGFEVPKGYFDDVEDQFSAKLREESLPKSTGFEIPEGYFDGLEDAILSKVELPKKGKVIPLRRRILRVASIAAAFVFLFSAYLMIYDTGNVEPSSDEITAWMEENIDGFDTNDIVYAFVEDEIALDESFFDDTLENNNIEKYLDENDTYRLIEESPGLFDEIN